MDVSMEHEEIRRQLSDLRVIHGPITSTLDLQYYKALIHYLKKGSLYIEPFGAAKILADNRRQMISTTMQLHSRPLIHTNNWSCNRLSTEPNHSRSPHKVNDLGDNGGPIASITEQLYLRRLAHSKNWSCNRLPSEPFHSVSPLKENYLCDNPGPITSATQQLHSRPLIHTNNWSCNRLSTEPNHSRSPSEVKDLNNNRRPITSTTKQLHSRRSKPIYSKSPTKVSYRERNLKRNLKGFKRDLNPFLKYGDWVNYLGRYRIMEKEIFKEFSIVDPSREWREGTNKTSFNYLLLDPRITKDLPSCAKKLANSTVWSTFLSSIFYVGKGTRNRPYAHLKDALDVWDLNRRSENTKIQRILNIWNEGYGVICLHIYQNTIPVEAYTREAAMIDAFGLNNLTNCKYGDYYGIAATWNIPEKCNFGRYLLHGAMQIYLHEGERPIFPNDI